MRVHYDLLVIGGGPIGMSLAIALKETALSVGLIEREPLLSPTALDADGRSIALTYGSGKIFQEMGQWGELQTQAVPIAEVHVSNRGHFGFTRLKAEEMALPAIGYVIEAQHLLARLNQSVADLPHCHFMNQTTVSHLERKGPHWEVTLATKEGPQLVTADLLVAADGGRSMTRQLLGIDVKAHDYQQHAIIANVNLSQEHQGVAYERFLQSGALALLPMTKQRSSLIYTVASPQATALLNQSDDEFLHVIQQQFGYRLGRFAGIGRRFSYPLHSMQAKQQVLPGAVLLGNAAHTLHPIAGQGFNLGLRDVICLSQVLKSACARGESIAQLAVLQRYYEARALDQQWMLNFTDNLVRIFNFNFLPWNVARNIGMLTLDMVPPAKSWFAKRSMGLLQERIGRWDNAESI